MDMTKDEIKILNEELDKVVDKVMNTLIDEANRIQSKKTRLFLAAKVASASCELLGAVLGGSTKPEFVDITLQKTLNMCNDAAKKAAKEAGEYFCSAH